MFPHSQTVSLSKNGTIFEDKSEKDVQDTQSEGSEIPVLGFCYGSGSTDPKVLIRDGLNSTRLSMSQFWKWAKHHPDVQYDYDYDSCAMRPEIRRHRSGVSYFDLEEWRMRHPRIETLLSMENTPYACEVGSEESDNKSLYTIELRSTCTSKSDDSRNEGKLSEKTAWWHCMRIRKRMNKLSRAFFKNAAKFRCCCINVHTVGNEM
ncbi:hypothetical protein BWQ96_07697 [Gracilariopsis chorda]|uniref:Uncharacterized protein n=1 Tax=Gracilariopsis chorda TaxID=448386 RepID=A0A2V3IKB6_9FLOR|nr:hypothetical protein BWQ96_10620 [Gracilariopsis chorda]PXF42244.1 hypothetical protein BWQ96_08022 [Gracilariopsis chorda]PXF42535.1 hypothetical protein BWQ96_07697 [Gracilariopsis chorda]|eukprot:PXF39680.1 hypothetical protein BWQ96_10620 [Gracilariopsis chorda]